MLTRVGDVARELGETEVTIRWWATQFAHFLGPYKASAQRRFSPHAVDVLREVQRLVREELYTLEGAKRQLRKAKDEREKSGPGDTGTRMSGESHG